MFFAESEFLRDSSTEGCQQQMTDHLCPTFCFVPSVFCDTKIRAKPRGDSETIRGKDLAKIWIFCRLVFVKPTETNSLYAGRSIYCINTAAFIGPTRSFESRCGLATQAAGNTNPMMRETYNGRSSPRPIEKQQGPDHGGY
jgi:hypothetical protein